MCVCQPVLAPFSTALLLGQDDLLAIIYRGGEGGLQVGMMDIQRLFFPNGAKTYTNN